MKQIQRGQVLTSKNVNVAIMPDVVRHKKFKNDVFWVSYNNPETNVKVDFLSIKFPESERMAIAGKASSQEVGLGYEKEQSGIAYETFVISSSTILPIDTFKEIASRSLTQASGTQVLPSNVSTYGVSGLLGAAETPLPTFECPNCQIRMMIEKQPKFCPSCGYKFQYVAKSDTERRTT